ncbi:MAG: EAL domain-containing protein, partial [Lachnospiraceae bacterium]|nr:EAL domain-containing protein [Lachnospiraceae bacterium]
MSKTKIRKTVKYITICLITLMLSGAAAASAWTAETGSGTLTVGVPSDRCPVFYIDEDTGKNVGIGVDLMRTAAEYAGFTTEFVTVKESTLKEALDSTSYDVVMPFGSAIKSAEGKQTVVSDNLIQTPFTIVTEKGHEVPPIADIRIGMLKSLGGGADTVRELYPAIEITMFDTMDECVKALHAGKVDALLHNSYVWSYVLQKPAYRDLSVQPSAMFSMDFRAGTVDTPEGRELILKLNKGIEQLTDTRRQAVILDHTSRRLYRYDAFDYLYQYGLVLLLLALLFISLIVILIMRIRALRKKQEEKLRKLIDYDPLTGLLSMSGFRKRVKELLDAHPDIPYTLSYNNIKNFKFINDSLGMDAGDELLRFWASKTMESLTDVEAVGRIEGDHFAVLRRMGGDEQMIFDEKNVIDPVRNYFLSKDRTKRIQICTGVYMLMPEDYVKKDVDHMLDLARVAEERVRDTRKDGYELYNPEQWEHGKRVADVIGHLPMAITAEELHVWYQPQVDFRTGDIVGTEALCRWNHARLGWLRPAEFIPVLEDSGLIYDLDCHVWEQVCRDLKRWKDQGHYRCVSVNLSRKSIREDINIPGRFYDLIQKYGLDPGQLKIEITETAYVENPELLIKTTVKLREFGFQVEMDDFGSGYSSLHMLKEVPVDRIKLDLHFLKGTGEPERGRIIISYMIQMVHSLGMNLIAEGVENAAQARFLESRGCPVMQGFYFYKPMPVEE